MKTQNPNQMKLNSVNKTYEFQCMKLNSFPQLRVTEHQFDIGLQILMIEESSPIHYNSTLKHKQI